VTPSYSIKSLMFELIPDASAAATEEYPNFSQRDLYYLCRNRYLTHPERPYHREYMIKREKDETDEQYAARRERVRQSREPIDYKYFTTKILRHYEQERGKIDGMIREPHGTFVEPHTGESVELGTREVAGYTFPDHRFDKILYVEKGTEKPKFEHEQIAEKYDMALIYGSGYATEAIHDLLDVAVEGKYQLFIWHDADVDGYNIVRNLREETENMPLEIEIVDIGLTVEEALRIGCASEPFSDDDALPKKLGPLLNDTELEYFEQRKTRFEINGINPATQRMAYVEEQLQKHGIRPKYVPPEDELERLVEDDLVATVRSRVGTLIDAIVEKESIVEAVMEDLGDELRIENPEAFIRQRFEQRPTQSWNTVVDLAHWRQVREANEKIRAKVREAVVTM
jgi:hypothetical protein